MEMMMAEPTELQALLDRATKGPWRHSVMGVIVSETAPGWVAVADVGSYRDLELIPFNKDRWDADAALIALTPTLAADVIRLTAELAEARAANAALTGLGDAAREVIAFYADADQTGYDVDVTNYGLSTECGAIIRDCGERARAWEARNG